MYLGGTDMSIIALLYYLVALIAALILLNAYKKGTTIGKKIGKVMKILGLCLVMAYMIAMTI